MNRTPSTTAKRLDVLKFMVDAFSPPQTQHEHLMLRAYEAILNKMKFEASNTRLEVEGSNDPGAPTPGVHTEKVKSGGSLAGTDHTGRGVKVVEA